MYTRIIQTPAQKARATTLKPPSSKVNADKVQNQRCLACGFLGLQIDRGVGLEASRATDQKQTKGP